MVQTHCIDFIIINSVATLFLLDVHLSSSFVIAYSFNVVLSVFAVLNQIVIRRHDMQERSHDNLSRGFRVPMNFIEFLYIIRVL